MPFVSASVPGIAIIPQPCDPATAVRVSSSKEAIAVASRKKRAPKKGARKRATAPRKSSPKKVARKVAPILKPFREPLKPAKLVGLEKRDADHLIATERKLFTAQLQEKLRTVRQFFGGFESRDGYPLDAHGIVRIHPSKYDRLLYHFEQVQRATSVPYLTFKPKNEAEKAAAINRAGELGKNQKVFVIHHLDAKVSTVRYVPDESGSDEYGTLEIVTKAGSGAVFERIYYFPKRPKSWKGVRKQTELLMKRGMRTGFYKIFNTIYGPLGEPSQREKLLETLDLFWSTYNKWLAGTILGWAWIGTTLDSALARQDKQQTMADKFQEARKERQKRETNRIKRRLGIKVKRAKRGKVRKK